MINSHAQTRKSPLDAGSCVRWHGTIGASTAVLGTTAAGDYTNDCCIGATSMPAYSGTSSRACATPSVSPSYPDPSAIRRFTRFISELQHANGGQPVILHPSEIARATGITETEQIRVRQTLMNAGVLRLSVVGNDWAYHLEGPA